MAGEERGTCLHIQLFLGEKDRHEAVALWLVTLVGQQRTDHMFLLQLAVMCGHLWLWVGLYAVFWQ